MKKQHKNSVLVKELKALLKNRTQREAARLLGVSERTIRRWKNEGTSPKQKSAERVDFIYSEDKKAKKITRAGRVKAKLVKSIGGSTYYEVHRTGTQNIARVLQVIHRAFPADVPPLFRLIIRVPPGGIDYRGRVLRDGGFYSSQIASLEHAESLTDYVDMIYDANRHDEIHSVVMMLPWTKKSNG